MSITIEAQNTSLSFSVSIFPEKIGVPGPRRTPVELHATIEDHSLTFYGEFSGYTLSIIKDDEEVYSSTFTTLNQVFEIPADINGLITIQVTDNFFFNYEADIII